MRAVAAWMVALATVASSAAMAQGPDGKAVYRQACAACHDSGAAGAPKTGAADQWKPRFAMGIGQLYKSATSGKGAMPAKGGQSSLSPAEVEAAVNFMVLQADGGGATGPAAKGRAEAPAGVAAKSAPAAPAAGGASGQTVYAASCAACHASGAAGAPKTGDAAAWAAKLKSGVPALQANALNGKGAMPPKGGNASLSDADVRAAVAYMVAQSGGPKAAADASPAPVAATTPKSATPAPPVMVASAAPSAVTIAPAPASAARVTAPAAAAAPAASPNAFNRLLRAPGKRNVAPPEDGIHDPGNEETHLLQPPLSALGSLPRSNSGNGVDWGKAYAAAQVAPRHDRLDPSVAPTVMDLNIVREVKGTMPDVVFPHKQHTQWLDCANCHPTIFKPQKGANQISMASILVGEACGVCHGKVAFPVSECRLCHSKAKPAVAAK
jgi:c(7)-type cytochrome triheme protein